MSDYVGIQLKRAFTFTGTADEALSKIKALTGNQALKAGEQLAVRYLDVLNSRYRYMVVLCTSIGVDGVPQLSITPQFDDLRDFIKYIKDNAGSSEAGASTAEQLTYIFDNQDLGIQGENQEQFNNLVMHVLESMQDSLTWVHL